VNKTLIEHCQRTTAACEAQREDGVWDQHRVVLDPDRPLSLGWPERYGSAGVALRIEKMAGLWPLEGRRLLDVGCGNGSYTTELAAGFIEAYGIEIETDRLGEFRRVLADRVDASRFHLAEMSAESLDFPDGYFDVVTAIEVIEHIVDLPTAVREVHRVLRPGGAFLITAPNRAFPIETHSFKFRGREVPSKRWPFVPWVPPLHRRLSTARNFRPKDLRQLLQPVGFHERGVDFLMPPFERWGPGRHLRSLTTRLEHTVFKTFGVSVIAAFQKL
jgi:SAM-dependent methyltransferase